MKSLSKYVTLLGALAWVAIIPALYYTGVDCAERKPEPAAKPPMPKPPESTRPALESDRPRTQTRTDYWLILSAGPDPNYPVSAGCSLRLKGVVLASNLVLRTNLATTGGANE